MEKKTQQVEAHETYGADMQKVLVSFMVSDPTSFALTQNIIKPEYFNGPLRPAVRAILEYANEYKTLPTPEQVKAMSKVDVEVMSGDLSQHAKWFCNTMEGFCRYKALELVILDASDMLETGQGADVERRVKEAMTISLMSDLGVSYFEDPLLRLQRVQDRSDFMTSGWKTLDDKLNGGFTKGALNVFAGGSGSGKSLFLQNIALSWALLGLNVVYFSLELSEDLVAMRIDSMTSGVSSRDVLKEMASVSFAVAKKGKGAGDLHIKKMPEAGTTANDLRAYVKEYEIQHGRKPDAIIVDYLDLMHPNNSKVDPGNLFTKDKYTSEEMRAMAGELDCLCVTASQLNRASVEAAEFDHSHIAGGISKINTADNVFGIFTTSTMRESGKYELQFLKTRSAAAVGQKIQLKFNVQSLRIEDQDGSAAVTAPKTAGLIREELKKATGTSAKLPGQTPNMTPVTVPEGGSLRASMMDLIQNSKRPK